MIDMRAVHDDIDAAGQAGPVALSEFTARILTDLTAAARARLAELAQVSKDGDRSPQAEA
jgi:hypothetical protein